MSGYLIPVALSSEIDDNGFEHIHAASSALDTGRRVLPLDIAGNIANGQVGDIVTGEYNIIGGRPPYGDVTVVLGAFPAGLVLAADGAYAGTLTTAGTYSWTISVSDYNSAVATLSNSMTVASNG